MLIIYEPVVIDSVPAAAFLELLKLKNKTNALNKRSDTTGMMYANLIVIRNRGRFCGLFISFNLLSIQNIFKFIYYLLL